MSTQKVHEEITITNEKKGKRKAQYCDLEGQDDIACDYEKHGHLLYLSK